MLTYFYSPVPFIFTQLNLYYLCIPLGNNFYVHRLDKFAYLLYADSLKLTLFSGDDP